MFTYGDLGDVVGLRGARIGVDGDLLTDRRYKFEVDLATGQVVPRDIFLAHGSPPNGERRWGHYREPFSLEGNISANYYQFMERSPINALDPARGWGLCIYRCAPSEDATFALGVGPRVFFPKAPPEGAVKVPFLPKGAIGVGRELVGETPFEHGQRLVHATRLAKGGHGPVREERCRRHQPGVRFQQFGQDCAGLFR